MAYRNKTIFTRSYTVFFTLFFSAMLAGCGSDDDNDSTGTQMPVSNVDGNVCFFNSSRNECAAIAEDFYVTSFISGNGNQCPLGFAPFDAQSSGDIGSCAFNNLDQSLTGGLANFDILPSEVIIPNPQNITCGANNPNYIAELGTLPMWRINENGQIHFKVFADDTLMPDAIFTTNSIDIFSPDGRFFSAGALVDISRTGISSWNGVEQEDFVTFESVNSIDDANLVFQWENFIDFTSDNTIADARITEIFPSTGHASKGLIRFNISNIEERLVEAAALPSSELQINSFMNAVAAHEVGHILGILHPFRTVEEAIMAPIARDVGRYFLGRGQSALPPTDLDRNSLKELYCSEFG